MSHTLCRAIFHVVFSTKERRNLIPREDIDRTWAYIAGIGRNHGVQMYAVGGTENHVHALLEIRPDTTLSDAVRVVKTNSSRWLRESVATFSWQEGYSAFSVSPPRVAAVANYIRNQEKHHAKESFDDELDAISRAAALTEKCRP
jgi:REP element-mobilizing transposase RayT